jgi:hypothetical protein
VPGDLTDADLRTASVMSWKLDVVAPGTLSSPSPSNATVRARLLKKLRPEIRAKVRAMSLARVTIKYPGTRPNPRFNGRLLWVVILGDVETPEPGGPHRPATSTPRTTPTTYRSDIALLIDPKDFRTEIAQTFTADT